MIYHLRTSLILALVILLGWGLYYFVNSNPELFGKTSTTKTTTTQNTIANSSSSSDQQPTDYNYSSTVTTQYPATDVTVPAISSKEADDFVKKFVDQDNNLYSGSGQTTVTYDESGNQKILTTTNNALNMDDLFKLQNTSGQNFDKESYDGLEELNPVGNYASWTGGTATSLSAVDKFNSDALLPQQVNTPWQLPQGDLAPKAQDLININRMVGIDSIGSTRKNNLRDLRSQPEVPTFGVSPWNMSVISINPFSKNGIDTDCSTACGGVNARAFSI